MNRTNTLTRKREKKSIGFVGNNNQLLLLLLLSRLGIVLLDHDLKVRVTKCNEANAVGDAFLQLQPGDA